MARFSNSQSFWLTLYFALNLSLTLHNKMVLVSFPFPYTLTALHALCGSLGGGLMLRNGLYQPKRLREKDYVVLVAFSMLYSINIAVSNVSLRLVTVPLHQVVRAASPIFTMILSWYLFRARFSRHKLLSLLPVVLGLGLATYGDYYCTFWGFVLTLLGTILAALKTIATNVLQSSTSDSDSAPTTNADSSTLSSKSTPSPSPFSRSRRLSLPFPSGSQLSDWIGDKVRVRMGLHPLDLLTRTSPLALVQCALYAHLSGELEALQGRGAQGQSHGKGTNSGEGIGMGVVWMLLVNGGIAFALNVVSFEANRRAGALSMNVAANVKQVLTILCAVSLFQLTITPANALGIGLTLLGGAWYALVQYREKKAVRRATAAAGADLTARSRSS